MSNSSSIDRRHFIIACSTLGSSLLVPQISFAKEDETEEVGPAEDLMREHGGLNRILLIYEEGIRRITAKTNVDLSVVKKSATIVRTFIEEYHEKLEEEFIFPRMRKEKKLVELVDTLETQHKAGRKLTATIEQLSVQSTLKSESETAKLISAINQFIRMYRPHESREDTVLFPTFHKMLSEKEYDMLGEKFEDREHKLFGKEGFDGIVEKIMELEKSYDIYDLTKFTPHI
ncbi:hemerythrin domain-containing protein [Bdellovibrio sp. NC01]|uniref:hemerythrin domain-containing protein n=1 Tax=Bdellovibrio sp. NC01 TaxID=2220073 RepID=UPI001159FBBB|nr:hemerythrin domain-containing protein [Bdellovibrio sp. NC01]